MLPQSTRSTKSTYICMALIVLVSTFGTGLVANANERGEQLYTRYCAECHGPLETTDKPNRPYGRLASAIRVVPSMYHLKNLNSDDLDAIVEVTTQPERPSFSRR